MNFNFGPMYDVPQIKPAPERLTKYRSFLITEKMDNQMAELFERKGKRAVLIWLRDLWARALDHALSETPTPKGGAPVISSAAANLDYESDY